MEIRPTAAQTRDFLKSISNDSRNGAAHVIFASGHMSSVALIMFCRDKIHVNSVRNMCTNKNTETGINTYKKFNDWLLQEQCLPNI